MSKYLSRDMAGCKQIEIHIQQNGFDGLPNPLAGVEGVDIFVRGEDISLQAHGDFLPFIVALCSGAQVGTLSRVLREHPFDLRELAKHCVFGLEDFSIKLPNGEQLDPKGLYSRMMQAFAITYPDHLRESAATLQKLEGCAVFAAMETGIPEIELGTLIERERQAFKFGTLEGLATFGLELALSESPYYLREPSTLPDFSPISFLRKSGALDQDFLNGTFTTPSFWENLIFTALNGLDRSSLCNLLVETAFEHIEAFEPGTVLRLIRSLDFSRLEEATFDATLMKAFSIGGRPDILGSSMLFKIGLLQVGVHSEADAGLIPLEYLLTPSILSKAGGRMDIFAHTPDVIVHELLTEIAGLPVSQIGQNTFSSLAMVSRLQLPPQKWEVEVVSQAINKVLEALAAFTMEGVAERTSKGYIDASAIRSLRQFNNAYLRPWGLDASIFQQTDEGVANMLALAGFELTSLSQVSEAALRQRMEMDIGL